MLSPAVICTCVYLFRRRFSAPYIDNVSSTLATLAFGVLISVALGAVFLGRRAIELQTGIEVFLSILFDFSLGDFVGIYAQHSAVFIVTDDGGGIPEHIAQLANAEPTLGLLSMRERAKLINGEFDISQNKPSGTRVCLTLPYRA